MLKKLMLLSFVLFISSCGFKLRGGKENFTWLNNVAVVMEKGHPDLIPFLKNQLQAHTIKVNPNPTQADYLLVIENDVSQQQITNIGASTSPRQYLLVYTVQYSLLKVGGKQPIATARRVSVSRQLTVNNNMILGSDSEELTITDEMQQDAAIQIINRLYRL